MRMNIASLLKAKAPIVAIPVEGHAPACVEGKRLRIWAKGVTIQSVRIEQAPHQWYCREMPVPYAHEGPANLVEVKKIAPRFLVIEGQAGHIRTRAKFATIARADAIRTLSAWSDKERRVKVRVSASKRRAFKALEFEVEQDQLVFVSLKTKDVRVDYYGVPVSIPQFPLLSFAVVREGECSYIVTELLSGNACSFGTSAERALLAACENAATFSPERIGIITANCLAPPGGAGRSLLAP